MTCDKCKYFHILYEPLRTTGKLWDMGRAKCDKHNLITDFANYGKFKRLDTCEDYEPQESEKTETWNGIHGQITAPKGTFERIFNDADDDNDI